MADNHQRRTARNKDKIVGIATDMDNKVTWISMSEWASMLDRNYAPAVKIIKWAKAG